MTLWIGNGAILKSSSQWQLNEFGKLNNSDHELYIFFKFFYSAGLLTGTFKNCAITYP